MPRLDTTGGQDVAEALADHVGQDGVLTASGTDVVSTPTLLPGAPTQFTSSGNALAVNYSGIVEAYTIMSENTTLSVSNIAQYAKVILQIYGHADNDYTFTFPASQFYNTPDAARVITVNNDEFIWVTIYRDRNNDYIYTLSNAHVEVA